MMSSIIVITRSLRITWWGAWLESWANRRAFWSQVSATAVNDVAWVLFWLLFFRRVGTVRGWDVNQVIVLLSILTTSAGIVLGLLTNARHLGALAADGGLDAALALPTPTLPHLLVRRVDASCAGDLLFGLILFVAGGHPTPTRALVFVFGVTCGVLIFTGFLVLMGSLSFFIGRNEAGDLGFQALLLFSSYPVDLFAGLTKLFLFAVVPAGFVSSVPARLVDEFDLRWATATLAVSITLALTARAVFNFGLRRYTSGSVWTDA